MTQQRTYSNSSLLHLAARLLITFTIGCVQAETRQTTIEHHMVTFDPAIMATPEGKECMGLIYSADQIIMPPDCTRDAREVMSGRSVQILSQAGAVIGQLAVRKINSPQQLPRYLSAAPNMLLSFAPAFTESGTFKEFPVFFQTFRSRNATLSAPFYLWNTPEKSSSQWQELQSIRKTKPGHYILPLQDERTFYLKGAPVIDKRGRVVCLMTEADHCQGLASDDDKSCQMNCLKCTDYSWDSCSNGTGSGTCKNVHSGNTCDVSVFVNGDHVFVNSYPPEYATCTGRAGCGAVSCHFGDDNASCCDCVAGYGFDKDDLNVIDPGGCIDKTDNPGCDDVGAVGWPLIGAVLGVTAVAITTTIVFGIIYCKYRKRSGYKKIPDVR